MLIILGWEANAFLTFNDNVFLDYETNESIDITIRATDTGGLSYDETFTFNVVDDPSDNNLDNNTSPTDIFMTVTGFGNGIDSAKPFEIFENVILNQGGMAFKAELAS